MTCSDLKQVNEMTIDGLLEYGYPMPKVIEAMNYLLNGLKGHGYLFVDKENPDWCLDGFTYDYNEDEVSFKCRKIINEKRRSHVKKL